MSEQPRYRKARPPIDDTEYVDDLRRQNEDFVRGRTADYFGLYQRAASRLAQPDGYTHADVTTDAAELWGMLARDTVDVGLRFIRTMNQLATDTPVPTSPHRRANVEVEVTSTVRPLHLRCSKLVCVRKDSNGVTSHDVITPAEIEITPNPIPEKSAGAAADQRKVTVTVNAAAPKGTYTGRLLVFGDHPDNPIEAVKLSLDVPEGFSRS
jgi:hypothetical protein